VYACDYLQVELGANKILRHVPNYDDDTRGEVDSVTSELIGLRGGYTVTKYSDGSTDFEYMSVKDLNRIRGRSVSLDQGPWVTDPAEMYKKIPTRRMAKRWPLTPEAQTAAIHEESLESGNARSAELDVIHMPTLAAPMPEEPAPATKPPAEEKSDTPPEEQESDYRQANGLVDAVRSGRSKLGTKFVLLAMDFGDGTMEVYNFEEALMTACKVAEGHETRIKYHMASRPSGESMCILDDILAIDGQEYRNGQPIQGDEPKE
jgi:hypothetical protein